MNSIKLQNKMGTIFMNSENSKTSHSHRLLFNLSDKTDIKRSNKYVSLSNLSIYYTWENIKSLTTTINSKYPVQGGMKNLNYLMDHILHHIFKIILSISSKNKKLTDNPPIRIYVNKIQKKSHLKLKQGTMFNF